MEADFEPAAAASENPAFLYIMGDCVYYNGEIAEYYSQFYRPMNSIRVRFSPYRETTMVKICPAAIPLTDVLRNFCAPSPVGLF